MSLDCVWGITRPRRKIGIHDVFFFGPSRFGGGMKAADRPSRNVGKAASADLTANRPKPKLKKVMPEVWKLVKPRRWLLLGSFFLIIINRICSFALPVSSRYLINNLM